MRLLVAVSAPASADSGGAPVGVLVATSDPEREVFRLLSDALQGTRTGSSMLFAHDEAHLGTRSPAPDGPADGPARTPPEPAASRLASLLAKEGPSRGSGAGGQEVFAHAARVPGTPWTVLLTLDADEALSDYRRLAAVVVASLAAVVAALALAAAALVGRLRARHAAARSADRAGWTRALEGAADTVLLLGRDGTVTRALGAVERMYGRASAEMVGAPFATLCAPGLRDRLPEDLGASRDAPILSEATHRRADGRPFPVEVSIRSVSLDGRDTLVAVVRDITERRAAEDRIRALNRALRTRAAVGGLAGSATDRERFLRDAVERAVAEGGFALAWAGFLQPEEGGCVVPEAVAGPAAAYAEGIVVRADDSREGAGPTGRSIREGRAIAVEDAQTDPEFAPWRERAAAHGLRSSASAPIRVAGRVVGAFCLYASEPRAFDAQTLGVVQSLADDLGVGLGSLEDRRRRLESDARLLASERSHRLLFESNPIPMWVYDRATLAFLAVNDAAVTAYGWSRGEFLGMTIREILPPEDVPTLERRIAENPPGPVDSGDWRHRRRDGTVFVAHVLSDRVEWEGREARLVAAHDVTARRAAEREVVRARDFYLSLFDEFPALIWRTDRDGRCDYVNRAWRDLTGQSPSPGDPGSRFAPSTPTTARGARPSSPSTAPAASRSPAGTA